MNSIRGRLYDILHVITDLLEIEKHHSPLKDSPFRNECVLQHSAELIFHIFISKPA